MIDLYTVVPLSALRKVIAARMTEAKQTIPHFRIVADLDMDAVLAARSRFNATHSGSKVSFNDCMIKACAEALMKHPAVTSNWSATRSISITKRTSP